MRDPGTLGKSGSSDPVSPTVAPSVDAPPSASGFLGGLARCRMLPSVRPLMQRWSCGPVWEFADRNQIINACSRHDEYIWFFRPRLADCCAMPTFDRLHLRRPQARQTHALATTGAL